MSTSNRICLFEKSEDHIVISVIADDFIVAGADFKLFDPESKDVIENWKLTVDYGKASNYSIKTPVSDLNKLSLAWNILCCSRDPKQFEGKVMIKILQKGKAIKLSIPANYKLSNIPPCALNSAEEFKGNLLFVLKTDDLTI